MKKKIFIGTFLLLVLVTAIIFIVAAIDSYNYDMKNRETLSGFGAAIAIILGALIILCETDLFFTLYYFFMKPNTLSKSLYMIFSQLMIFVVIFSKDLVSFLARNVSDIFREEAVFMVPIFFLYVILRVICISKCYSKID